MSDSDDDVEYDPSAVAVVPVASVPVVSVHEHAPLHTIHPIEQLRRPAVGNVLQQRIDTAKPFPLVSHWRLPHKSPITSIALQPNGGTQLCVGNREGSMFMFDFNDREEKEDADDKPKHGATRQRPNTVKNEITDRRPFSATRLMTPFPTSHGTNHAITHLSYLASGRTVLLGCDGDHLLAVDALSGRQLDRCAVGSRSVMDTVRSPGHKAAITCVSDVGEGFCTGSLDGTVRVWDVRGMRHGSKFAAKHGQCAAATLTDTIAVNGCCAVGDDGATVASGGSDGAVQVWDVRSAYRPGRSAIVILPTKDHPGPSSVERLLKVHEHLIVSLDSNGALATLDPRFPQGVLTSSSCGGLKSTSRAPTLTLHRRSSTAPPTIFVVAGGCGGRSGPALLMEFSLDARKLREMLIGQGLPGTAPAAAAADDAMDGLACVSTDGDNDEIFASDGCSSTVCLFRASTASSTSTSKLSPARQWVEWCLGRSAVGVKRTRGESKWHDGKRQGLSLEDDAALELF